MLQAHVQLFDQSYSSAGYYALVRVNSIPIAAMPYHLAIRLLGELRVALVPAPSEYSAGAMGDRPTLVFITYREFRHYWLAQQLNLSLYEIRKQMEEIDTNGVYKDIDEENLKPYVHNHYANKAPDNQMELGIDGNTALQPEPDSELPDF